MDGDAATRVVVPIELGGVEVLVQAAAVTAPGSEPTSVAGRVADAYRRAESTIVAVASAVAGTIDRLGQQEREPRQVEVRFGLGVSMAGDVVVMQGATEATLAVTLTYATGSSGATGSPEDVERAHPSDMTDG